MNSQINAMNQQEMPNEYKNEISKWKPTVSQGTNDRKQLRKALRNTSLASPKRCRTIAVFIKQEIRSSINQCFPNLGK